ncbi:MAG: hypothetical protein KGL53_04950, partial [Elusimicrobia bacterium]|nr:hypothetical protein [Elusimicrobiota bacterium]
MDTNRMLKLAAVVGAAGAVGLAALGMFAPKPEDSQQYLGWRSLGTTPVSPNDAPELTADERAEALAPSLKSESPEVRQTAREALSALLADETIGDDARKQVAGGLVAELAESTGTDQDDAAERADCLQLLVASVKGPDARAAAEKALATGTDGDRTAVARALLAPGALRGGRVYEMAYELTHTASIPESVKPALIRRIRGKNAEEDLMAMVRDTKDKRALAAAAVEVENLRKPELLGPVIARLDTMGMMTAKTLPWFSGELLSEHIAKSSGQDLLEALKVVWTRP